MSWLPRGCASGRLDVTMDGMVRGWLHVPGLDARPLVTVNGKPARLLAYREPRGDVCERLRIDEPTGFTFHSPGVRKGDLVELFAVTPVGIIPVVTRPAAAPSPQTEFIAQLERAREIAAKPGAVAVTSWDGGHNPVGRAMVLHDVVATHRPVVLFTYLFEEFGGRLWPPLLSTDCAVVAIPWQGRPPFEGALVRADLRFETVWIAKPRLPGLLLARMVSAPHARVILDHDDNEFHLSRLEGSRGKVYGDVSVNLVRAVSRRVTARTAASVTLAEALSAPIVRHARRAREDAVPPRPPAERRHVGFVGTVRPHKRLVEASQAIAAFARLTGRDLEFHVYGDFKPAELAGQLARTGARVRHHVPIADLPDVLARMDVVLTGFPGVGQDEAAITRDQIPAKIGDALAARRPVLVPRSPSTDDIDGLTGVFRFDALDFGDALGLALACEDPVTLPEEFTPQGAYRRFRSAEDRAAPGIAPLAMLPLPSAPLRADRPALLLVWKQHDAGLYGRRVDQIARAYRAAHPDHDTIVLETMPASRLRYLQSRADRFGGDHRLIVSLSRQKRDGMIDADGVRYHQIAYASDAELTDAVRLFLLGHRLMPANTIVVLMPVIQDYDSLQDVLAPYRTVVDIVDNQASWAAPEKHVDYFAQYTTMARQAEAIIFNSGINRDHFRRMGLIPEDRPVHVLENWYRAPAGWTPAPSTARRDEGGLQLVYSGNMRDRIDWSVFRAVADIEGVVLHLLGTFAEDDQAVKGLAEEGDIVFHGPRGERETLDVLGRMDAALMPHRTDEFSQFMNPMKVRMYKAVGLPVLASPVPGVAADADVTLASGKAAFRTTVELWAREGPPRRGAPRSAPEGTALAAMRGYMRLIDRLRGCCEAPPPARPDEAAAAGPVHDD